MRPYLQHGSRHRPDGSDPIPSSGVGIEWCYVKRTTSITIGAGVTRLIPWTSIETSDSSLFALGTNTLTNDEVVCQRAGIYITNATCTPSSPAAYPLQFFLNSNNTNPLGTSGQNFLTDGGATNTPAGYLNQPRDHRVDVPNALPCSIFAEFINHDASSHNVGFVDMGIVYLPNSTLFT